MKLICVICDTASTSMVYFESWFKKEMWTSHRIGAEIDLGLLRDLKARASLILKFGSPLIVTLRSYGPTNIFVSSFNASSLRSEALYARKLSTTSKSFPVPLSTSLPTIHKYPTPKISTDPIPPY